MTEQSTETRTVQQYRHAARRSLTEARERLALRTDETKTVYNLLNGTIEGVIRGVVGLSQEEQVERLSEAKARAEENLQSLPEAVEAAKAAIIAQVDAWGDSITEKAQEAIATLDEAANFAAERDFTAHQQRKGRNTSYDESEDEEGEDYEG